VTAPVVGLDEAVGAVTDTTDGALLIEFIEVRRVISPEQQFVRVDTVTEVRRVDRSSIERLEVSTGQRTRTGNGFILGLLIGGTLGGVAGHALGDDEECSGFCPAPEASKGTLAGVGAVGLGLVGGALGAVLGRLSRTDIWSPIAPETTADLHPTLKMRRQSIAIEFARSVWW
jgi:hypothetical protein